MKRNYLSGMFFLIFIIFFAGISFDLFTPDVSRAYVDNDGDGYAVDADNNPDCNDNDPEINPGAGEVCDGVDNDCDGLTDESYCETKVWKPLPLRSEKQAEWGMFGGEGMQKIFSVSFAPSNPEVAYFVTDTSGVWRGEWSNVGTNPGTGEDEECFFWESKRGYFDESAGEHKGFRASGGVSLAVDPLNHDVVFVSGARHSSSSWMRSDLNGIYRTTDGGQSWERVFSTHYHRNSEGSHYAFKPGTFNGTQHTTIYAGTHEDGLLKSSDGGDSWAVIGLEGNMIHDLEIEMVNTEWFNLNWQYRQMITVKSEIADENLEDFPVLINLNDSTNPLFDRALNSGDDIFFTLTEGTRLDHEIERYESSDGSENLTAWVRIPSLNASTNTSIYMYYGNADAVSQESPEGVWDDNFTMVQHLEEQTGPHNDSTSNANNYPYVDVTKQGDPSSGLIGGADEFNGLDDTVTYGQLIRNLMNQTDNVGMMEAWFKPTGDPESKDIMYDLPSPLGDNWGGTGIFRGIYPNGGDDRIWIYNAGYGGNPDCIASTVYNRDEWVHIIWHMNNDTLTLYKNGVPVDSSSCTIMGDGRLMIGQNYPGSGFFKGNIDEVRVSNIARTSSWISASYKNHTENCADGCLIFGNEEVKNQNLEEDTVVLYVATVQGLFKVEDNNVDQPEVLSWGNLPDYPRSLAIDTEARQRNADSLLYAAVGTHKVYKSASGGRSFIQKSEGLPELSYDYKLISISKSNPDYLYVYIYQYFNDQPYFSHDGGETWNKPSNIDAFGLSLRPGSTSDSNVSIHPTNENVAIKSFGATSRISITENGGQTWRYCSNGFMGGDRPYNESVYFGPIDPVDPDNRKLIFFLYDSGPILSEDNGSSWRLLMKDSSYPKSTLLGTVLYNGRIISVKGGHNWQCMARSDDNGESWTIFQGGDTSYTECGNGLQVDSQGIVRDSQAGNMYIAPRIDGHFLFMEANPGGSQYIYSGGKEGGCIDWDTSGNCIKWGSVGMSWISQDGGESWGSWNRETGEWQDNTRLTDLSIRAVFPGDGDDDGINGDIVYAFQQCSYANCIDVSERPSTCYVSNGNQVLIWRSEDSGVSWSHTDCLLAGIPQLDGIDIDPGDPNRLYAATSWGLYICDNAGCNRSDNGIDTEFYEGAFTTGTDEIKLRRVLADPNNPDIVYAGMWSSFGQRREFIYRSADRGKTWEGISSNPYLINPDFSLEGYAKLTALAIDPETSVLYMDFYSGNYVLCSDSDSDGYAVEGGPCGPVDIDDNNPAIYRIEDLSAKDQNFKIKLQWTCAPGTGTYNIYRGTVQGGPYELIQENHPTDECNYSDNDENLVDGQTYYYVVRWADANGHETADSNEAAGAVSH